MMMRLSRPCAALRTASLACLALVPAATTNAQRATAASAPIADVRYDVTVDSTTVRSRDIAVAMRFRATGAGPVVLALPAWSPGHYVLLWFARRVSRFSAESNGRAIPWHMRDFQTWELETRARDSVTVTFHYLADINDRAVAWTQRDFAFFNGTNLFLYPVGRSTDFKATVAVHTTPGWRIATGMTRLSGTDTPARHEETFAESNYHDLVDKPFFVGRFDIDSVQAGSAWVRLATYPAGAVTGARHDRTLGWLAKIAPIEGAVFGEIPWKTYTVLQLSDTVVNGGGLEHSNSQLDEVLLSQLDAPLAGLYAHEMFHSWNVKRLRPADMVPYRYADAQPTPWLWVSEGVTDYYGALAQVRTGIIDPAGFYQFIALTVTSVVSTPPVAVADASLEAWTAPLDGTAGIYYPKGALTGFLLDVMIRNASDDRGSLDQVMRELYRATYRHAFRGFTHADWWNAVSRAAGANSAASFAEFDRRYVTGREPLPIDSVLALAALRVVRDSVMEPRLGITVVDADGCARVTQVTPGGAASAAGIRVGDCIVSIGTVHTTGNQSFAELRSKYAGTTESALSAVIARADGATATVQVPVRLVGRPVIRVEEIAGASAKATRVRDAILHGR